MFAPGVYPAAVTPFRKDGEIDTPSVLRLLAYFEAAGCRGVVLAGTNGEGPSLAAVEKRDLLRTARSGQGGLKLILGVSTPSLSEADWLCSQAAKKGADAVLLMPPGAFRQATPIAVEKWLAKVIDRSPVPVIVYNFPKMCGFALTAESIARLANLPTMAGVKDSSGEEANLADYRRVLRDDQVLFIGDETLLLKALKAGWTGTISGAANTTPVGLCRVMSEWASSQPEQAELWFDQLLPVLRSVRSHPQPATNKAVLHSLGVIESLEPRLPLEAADPTEVLSVLQDRTGVRVGDLGLASWA